MTMEWEPTANKLVYLFWMKPGAHSESEKDGEPRNEVSEEGIESEGDWHTILEMFSQFSTLS